MDLLNQKGVLLAFCLIGAVLLVADEDQSDETPQPSQLETKVVEERESEEISVNNEPPTGPDQDTTQSSHTTELKPLELKERIRAHANIDLPQDI